MRLWILGVILVPAGVLLPETTAGATDGDFAWARAIGGPEDDRITGIALDNNGNIYTIGAFRGSMDFDPGYGVFELNAGDDNDGFVLKLDNAGNFVWAVAIEEEWVRDIALDGAGNVYTTGSFSGVVDFDPGPGVFKLTSERGACFVWKLNTSGNFLWAKVFTGHIGPLGGGAIAVDNEGNVYTTGVFQSVTDFDPGPGVFELSASADRGVAYVSKLDKDGNFVWVKAIPSTSISVEPNDIAVDDAGYVHVTGVIWSNSSLEYSSLQALPAFQSTYVSTLDKDGNFIRDFKLGEGHGQAVIVDDVGNLYILGMFSGTVDFDPGPGTWQLTALDDFFDSDMFVSKLDREGKLVWAIHIGGDDVNPLDFVTDVSKNLYITGTFEGSVDFDSGPETAVLTDPVGQSGWGVFILKIDPLGRLIWVKPIEVDGEPCIAVDRMEHTYTAGYCFGLDIDTGTGHFRLNPSGGADAVIIKRYGPQPIVEFIVPAGPNAKEGGLVPFMVKFGTEVTGVDVSDFKLATTGLLSDSQIINITGVGKEYTVMVAVAGKDGTVRLDLVDDDSITDSVGTPLGGLGKGNGDCIIGDIHVVFPEIEITLGMVLLSLFSLAIFPGSILLILVVSNLLLHHCVGKNKDKKP